MKYKGKKVSRHRYNQLVKTRDNHRKMMDEMYFAFHPNEAVKRDQLRNALIKQSIQDNREALQRLSQE